MKNALTIFDAIITIRRRKWRFFLHRGVVLRLLVVCEERIVHIVIVVRPSGVLLIIPARVQELPTAPPGGIIK